MFYYLEKFTYISLALGGIVFELYDLNEAFLDVLLTIFQEFCFVPPGRTGVIEPFAG